VAGFFSKLMTRTLKESHTPILKTLMFEVGNEYPRVERAPLKI